jgi:hypothetical protein
MQVPGGAAHHVGGGVARQGDGLFNALVFGAGFDTAPPKRLSAASLWLT